MHRVLRLGVLLAFVAVAAQPVSAQKLPDEAPLCEPPLSTCEFLPPPPVVAGAPLSIALDTCPIGYGCRCVPSCPVCADCAATVCVRDPSRDACESACDCPPGVGCFDGRCVPGGIPFLCCTDEVCPGGDACQDPSGGFRLCSADPSCPDRRAKVADAIAYLLERANRCEIDSDCARVVTSTTCEYTCGAWASAEHAAAFNGSVQWLDAEYCQGFGCAGLPLVCALSPGARCLEGRCVGVFAPLPLPPSVTLP